MNPKNSTWKTTIDRTTTYRDKIGRAQYSIREQAGQQVYYDTKGKRIGYIDGQGRTMSADNRILNYEPRPDLILKSLGNPK